ncbi:MAG: HAMP domain-containing sensor histidine kinase [Pirellulaceae bacterium]|nr:HAMP domain-containing sensor histidine kinase [Pirellulaceae bacterium]
MFSFLHSLRGRLLAWYAVILFLILLVFGTLLYSEIHRSHWERVEDELIGAARILEGTLRTVPQPILDSIAKDLGKPRGPRLPPGLGGPNGPGHNGPGGPNAPSGPGGPPNRDRRPPMNRDVPPRDFPPRDISAVGESLPPRPEDRMRPAVQIPWDRDIERAIEDLPQEKWEAMITFPRDLLQQSGTREGPTYFIIWRENRSIFKESSVPTSRPDMPDNIEDRFRRERYLRQQRGPYHEVFIRGPHRTLICVGRSIVAEQGRIQHLTLSLILSGASVFMIGMFGGWWLSRRATSSIQRMSLTAEQIQSSTLSRRIDINGFDTEFAQLGKVLNSMFDRLNESFEQQTRFVADASHEMRTPLSVILSSTELALSKERSSNEYRMQLETCQRSANRMHQLVESLLILARLDGKQSTEPTSSVDLSKLVEECIEWIKPLASERQIQFNTALSPCVVQGHANLLNQVISNLLLNAIQYNSPGGNVHIETKVEGSSAVLIVEDSGMGISAKDIPHLFERFYRVDQARSRNTGGSGLGLAICHRIVEIHGGTIEVTSTVGEGSKFIVRL